MRFLWCPLRERPQFTPIHLEIKKRDLSPFFSFFIMFEIGLNLNDSEHFLIITLRSSQVL
jgi:hypothetical protein